MAPKRGKTNSNKPAAAAAAAAAADAAVSSDAAAGAGTGNRPTTPHKPFRKAHDTIDQMYGTVRRELMSLFVDGHISDRDTGVRLLHLQKNRHQPTRMAKEIESACAANEGEEKVCDGPTSAIIEETMRQALRLYIEARVETGRAFADRSANIELAAAFAKNEAELIGKALSAKDAKEGLAALATTRLDFIDEKAEIRTDFCGYRATKTKDPKYAASVIIGKLNQARAAERKGNSVVLDTGVTDPNDPEGSVPGEPSSQGKPVDGKDSNNQTGMSDDNDDSGKGTLFVATTENDPIAELSAKFQSIDLVEDEKNLGQQFARSYPLHTSNSTHGFWLRYLMYNIPSAEERRKYGEGYGFTTAVPFPLDKTFQYEHDPAHGSEAYPINVNVDLHRVVPLFARWLDEANLGKAVHTELHDMKALYDKFQEEAMIKVLQARESWAERAAAAMAAAKEKSRSFTAAVNLPVLGSDMKHIKAESEKAIAHAHDMNYAAESARNAAMNPGVTRRSLADLTHMLIAFWTTVKTMLLWSINRTEHFIPDRRVFMLRIGQLVYELGHYHALCTNQPRCPPPGELLAAIVEHTFVSWSNFGGDCRDVTNGKVYPTVMHMNPRFPYHATNKGPMVGSQHAKNMREHILRQMLEEDNIFAFAAHGPNQADLGAYRLIRAINTSLVPVTLRSTLFTDRCLLPYCEIDSALTSWEPGSGEAHEKKGHFLMSWIAASGATIVHFDHMTLHKDPTRDARIALAERTAAESASKLAKTKKGAAAAAAAHKTRREESKKLETPIPHPRTSTQQRDFSTARHCYADGELYPRLADVLGRYIPTGGPRAFRYSHRHRTGNAEFVTLGTEIPGVLQFVMCDIAEYLIGPLTAETLSREWISLRQLISESKARGEVCDPYEATPNIKDSLMDEDLETHQMERINWYVQVTTQLHDEWIKAKGFLAQEYGMTTTDKERVPVLDQVRKWIDSGSDWTSVVPEIQEGADREVKLDAKTRSSLSKMSLTLPSARHMVETYKRIIANNEKATNKMKLSKSTIKEVRVQLAFFEEEIVRLSAAESNSSGATATAAAAAAGSIGAASATVAAGAAAAVPRPAKMEPTSAAFKALLTSRKRSAQ